MLLYSVQFHLLHLLIELVVWAQNQAAASLNDCSITSYSTLPYLIQLRQEVYIQYPFCICSVQLVV